MYYNQNNLVYAKSMRSNMTDAEALLWNELRAKRFLGLKFKRQVPIGEYIADFLCPDTHLIIELDGGQHNNESTIDYDNKRTLYFESQGYIVLRFWNNDVFFNMEGVLTRIKEAV